MVYLGEATYCPEDNKLRFYAFERLSEEDFQRVKKAGFRWAPKQKLFVKPRWTPSAEDLLLELCGSIEDEDKSPEERSADRAERFAMYRDKRFTEALGHADNYDSFDSVQGFQSEKKAGVSQRKQERQRVKAFTQWDKAEYWQARTKGVICSALYKSTASVRRGRILSIEKDKRSTVKAIKKQEIIKKAWEEAKNHEQAEYLAGCGETIRLVDPRTNKLESIYYLLRDKVLTWQEVKEKAADIKPSTWNVRFLKHYDLRLAYENQMLEAQGGQAGNIEMKEGGFIGDRQIFGINKSPETGRITSVKVYTVVRYGRNEGKEVLKSLNIQRVGEDVYRDPTEEEYQAYLEKKATKKAETKKANADKPKLINPTIEEAQRLQDIWNEGRKDIQTITTMTQAQYARMSKGSYSKYKTCVICEDGTEKSTHWNAKDRHKAQVCKVRKCYKEINGSWFDIPYSVIVITDKPQKKLPEFKKVAQVTEVIS